MRIYTCDKWTISMNKTKRNSLRSLAYHDEQVSTGLCLSIQLLLIFMHRDWVLSVSSLCILMRNCWLYEYLFFLLGNYLTLFSRLWHLSVCIFFFIENVEQWKWLGPIECYAYATIMNRNHLDVCTKVYQHVIYFKRKLMHVNSCN